MELTHLDKLYWPREKISKGDLIHYYESVARYLLPYLKNRPLVMRRFPNGIQGESFYQKDAGAHVPSFVRTKKVHHAERDISYILVQNIQTLLYVANLGSIELHPFHSRAQALEKPDYLIFDLDPEKISFDRVVDAAQAIHELLEEIGISSVCKTSGGTGLHIYVPLGAKYDYKQVKAFAGRVAAIVHARTSSFTSLARKPEQREKRVYLDILQNAKGQTAASVYSVRAKPGAPVSTPLAWKEVKAGLDPSDFTIRTVPGRLLKKGDLFKAVLQKGIDLKTCLKKLK